jgi:hypothetical protein
MRFQTKYNYERRFYIVKKIVTIVLASVMLVFVAVVANAAVGVVVEARKVDNQPNLEVIDSSWGEPVLKGITSASENCYSWTFYESDYEDRAMADGVGTAGTGPNGRRTWHPEDEPMDVWMLWDDNYFYFAFRTKDYDIAGAETAQRGDGAQLYIKPLDLVENPYDGVTTFDDHGVYDPYWYVWALGFDDWTTATAIREPGAVITAAGALDPAPIINVDPSQVGDDTMECIIAIPFSNLVLRKADLANLANKEFAITFLRVSNGTKVCTTPSGNESTSRGIYGGILWGKYLADNPHDNKYKNPTCKSLNTVILRDSSYVPTETEETIPPTTEETGTEAAPNLDGVSSWALTEVEAGIKEGLVPENLRANYTSPVSRGAVAGMFINLIEKATGKTIDEVMAEKGVSITEGVFEDTTDRNVLAANALGIINGTSKTKFSPNGTLKRAQIAAIINRVARVLGIETEGFTHEFNDITDNYAWADSELGWPVHAGIINGVGQGRFNPGGDLTTEQAILITYRGLNALK